jgi:hypothetical protein
MKTSPRQATLQASGQRHGCLGSLIRQRSRPKRPASFSDGSPNARLAMDGIK